MADLPVAGLLGGNNTTQGEYKTLIEQFRQYIEDNFGITNTKPSVRRTIEVALKTAEVIQWEIDNAQELTWAGGVYIDPDAIGANPTAKIYPDGTIVGSTDNGNYEKYPNGELFCRGIDAIDTTNIALGNIFVGSVVEFTFPVLFISAPNISPSVVATSGSVVAGTFATNINSLSKASIRLQAPVNTYLGQPAYTAKGEWK